MFSIILYPLKFLPIFGAVAAFFYMRSVKNSAFAIPGQQEEALIGKERVWVWLLSIISPVLAGAVFYFGWRKVLPKKAKQANLISFIVFGIWLLLVIFGVYQNWGLFTSFRESAYRQALEDSEKSLQEFGRATEGWKTYVASNNKSFFYPSGWFIEEFSSGFVGAILISNLDPKQLGGVSTDSLEATQDICAIEYVSGEGKSKSYYFNNSKNKAWCDDLLRQIDKKNGYSYGF